MEFNAPKTFVDWIIFLIYCGFILLSLWAVILLSLEFVLRKRLKVPPVPTTQDTPENAEATCRRCTELEAILNDEPSHWQRLKVGREIAEIVSAGKIPPKSTAQVEALGMRLDSELSRKVLFPGLQSQEHRLQTLIIMTVSIVLLGAFLCRRDLGALLIWLGFYFGLSFLAFLTPGYLREHHERSTLYKTVEKLFSAINHYSSAMIHKFSHPEYDAQWDEVYVGGERRGVTNFRETLSGRYILAIVLFIALWFVIVLLFVLLLLPILGVIGLVRNYLIFK